MTTIPIASAAAHPEFAEGIALVAGGSGGLGAGVCRSLAKAGANVALTYKSRLDAAERVADDVRREGREAIVLQMDLEDAAAVKVAVDDLKQRFGRIHSVVYAAGPPLEFQYIRDISPAEWATGHGCRRQRLLQSRVRNAAAPA